MISAGLPRFCHQDRSPLHLAAKNGHSSAVQQLLAAKASVDVVDDRGSWPLFDMCLIWIYVQKCIEQIL